MMARAGCRFIFLSLLLMVFAVRPAWADDSEHRDFSFFIDGKDACTSRMTIVQKDDGTAYMSATLDVKFRHLVFVDYTLKIESQEWWKNGQLVGLKTKANENGKKTEVTVAAESKLLRLRVNGLDRTIKSESWTTSFWKLADAKFHNKQIPVLEVDTGKEFNCELKYIATQSIKVGSELQDCYHFRVSSAPGPVDLWFDRHHRLVRQEFTESGHKTIVQLVNIRR